VRDDIPLAVPQLTSTELTSTELTSTELTCVPARRVDITEPRWEIYYAMVYAVCVAIVEAGSLSLTSRVIATVALAAMVPWYLLIGRPLMMSDEVAWEEAQTGWRTWGYLTGLVVLFAAVQSQNLNAWFLAFAISPQCFHVTTVRRGMCFVVALNGAAGLLVIVRGHGLENSMTAIGIMVFAIAFSYVYSRFTMQIIEKNLEHAALIEELSTARHELAAAHHEAGVLAERHRLAGEIHDTLAQGFTSIVTLVQAAEAGVDPQAAQVRRHLDMALATARDNLAEARVLVAALCPARLEDSSLGEALCRVAEATSAEAGIRTRTEIVGRVRPLPTGIEVVLLRVCQEALANVRKHAGASEVSVHLRYTDDQVELNVTDDGAGFDMASVDGGYGLRGMRDRVRAVGGTVGVESAPGAGTTVLVEVPA
jgi:signal transduction histidine kinase